MDINQIGTLDVLDDNRLINRRLTKSLEKLASGENVSSAREDPVLWSDVQGLKTAVGKLQAFSENLHRGSSSVRIASHAMETSESQLSLLGNILEAALSEPEGSAGRTDRLERYNELHEILNDLAAPDDLGARKLLDDPTQFGPAGPLEIAAGENGFTIVLPNRPIHTGADGLNLPKAGEPLPSDPSAPPIIADLENATEEEITSMLDALQNSRDLLVAKSKGLAVDASAIEQSSGFNDAFIERNEDAVSELNIPDLNAEATLAQALNLRSSLSIHGLTGFEETKKLALSLLQ